MKGERFVSETELLRMVHWSVPLPSLGPRPSSGMVQEPGKAAAERNELSGCSSMVLRR